MTILHSRLLATAVAARVFMPPALADEGEAIGRRVQDLLHAHQADVYACVQKSSPAPSGELLIRVFVGERGAVGRAQVLKDQSGGAASACLLESIRGWDISSLKADEGDQVVFPLAFKPGADKPLAPIVSPIVRSGDAKIYPIAGGKGTAKLFLDDAPGARIALDEITAQKGVKIAPHRHESSDEILYVLEGRGVTTIDNQTFQIGPGDVIRIEAGREHSLVVEQALRAIQIYTPSGPEQRFKGNVK